MVHVYCVCPVIKKGRYILLGAKACNHRISRSVHIYALKCNNANLTPSVHQPVQCIFNNISYAHLNNVCPRIWTDQQTLQTRYIEKIWMPTLTSLITYISSFS